MEFVAKKYTVLMNNEPVDLWIKNNEVKKAFFMEQKVALKLSKEVIEKIKDNPTKIINGANLQEDREFTKSISKMMSQKLEIAIAKNDKKILSRFARSELVPENMKDNFIEAINRPTGLRGILVKAVNKTNAIFQKLAQKIDRYFDNVKSKITDKKLDKYLDSYQMKEFNKAPPLKDLDKNISLNPKLLESAKEFLKRNNVKSISDDKISHQLLQNEFMQQQIKLGFKSIEAKTALAIISDRQRTQDDYMEKLSTFSSKNKEVEQLNQIIDKLKSRLGVFEKKEASKNETLEDFKIISKGIDKVEAIDLLLKNKEYQVLSDSKKQEFEDKYIFTQEPIKERAKEAKAISKELKQEVVQEVTTTLVRDATIDFSSKKVKDEINQTWKELQKINKDQQAQNRDFMNINAVKFNGVSKQKLESWQEFAIQKGADKEIVQKYIDASLRNAKELVKAGILKETTSGEYRFTDMYSKETLFKNLDKTNEVIAAKNKGIEKTITIDKKRELHERVENISSDKSFSELKNEKGEIDPDKLLSYSQKLESLSLQLREQANKSITRDDINLANTTSNTQQVENVR